MCLATMAYVYVQLRSMYYYLVTGSIIPTGLKFTDLHALTLVTVLMRSCNIDCFITFVIFLCP